MAVAAPHAATEAEYLGAERLRDAKHEWRSGLVVAMSGGSPRHNAIAGNVLTALKNALRGRGCLVFPSDQRVHVAATGLYTYPDVTVTCEKPRFHERDRDTLVNPKLLVEVLSGSTEAYDRGAKFKAYRSIPSLAEYLLVSPSERRVEHFHRLETGQWLLTVVESEEVLSLPALGCDIPVAVFYEELGPLDDTEASPSPPSAVIAG